MATVEQTLSSRARISNISQAIPSRGDLSQVLIIQSFASLGGVGYSMVIQRKSRACVGNDVERRLVSRGSATIPVSTALTSRARIFDSIYGALFL